MKPNKPIPAKQERHLNFCKVPKECTCYAKYWNTILATELLNERERILKEVDKAQFCIKTMKCLMQVQMKDNSKGDKYQAVPVSYLNQWFEILKKKIKAELKEGGE